MRSIIRSRMGFGPSVKATAGDIMKIQKRLRRRLTPIEATLFRKEPKVMIAGTFRSATNVTQAALKTHFRVNPVFNDWFWKHGMPPTLPMGPAPIPKDVPIIVMSKDPVAFNESIFRFWRARRPELNVGDDIGAFVRSRFLVYDNSGGDTRPRYLFRNPTEYWNQFYFSWQNWKEVKDQVMFVRCEDLMHDPDMILSTVADRFGLKRRTQGVIALPEKRVGPKSPARLEKHVAGLSIQDRDWIWSQVEPDVATEAGYSASETQA